jgi:hypothetical protein
VPPNYYDLLEIPSNANRFEALMGHKDGRMSEHDDHADVEAQIKYLEKPHMRRSNRLLHGRISDDGKTRQDRSQRALSLRKRKEIQALPWRYRTPRYAPTD